MPAEMRFRNGLRWRPRTGSSDMKLATIVLATLAITVCSPCADSQENASRGGGSLRRQQLRFARVRTASQEKDGVLRQILEAKGLTYPPRAMLLRAFKKEGVLELWAASSESGPYTLVKAYGICAT